MKSHLLLLLLLFHFSSPAAEIAKKCRVFKGKDETLNVCSIANVNTKLILKKIDSTFKSEYKNLRVLYWLNEEELIVVASKRVFESNLCEIDYDKIFKFNLKTNSVALLWDAEKNKAQILDNIVNIAVLKRDASEKACKSIFYITKAKPIQGNMGSKFNPLLMPGNFLVVTNLNDSVYFFDNKFTKMLGSFASYEGGQFILDAEISNKGTLVATIMKHTTKTCIKEWDIENNSVIFNSCIELNPLQFTLFRGGDDIYRFPDDFNKLQSFSNLKKGNLVEQLSDSTSVLQTDYFGFGELGMIKIVK